MKEIEYKFLVDKEKWAKLSKPEGELIVQGYLHKAENLVIRIRIKGSKAYLTIKGKSVGISRSEYEYEIPVQEAEAMIAEFIDKCIRKYRYEIEFAGKTWEVDEFKDKLEGLILAELEVNSEEESIELPDWVNEDVSEDPNYFNAVLIDRA